MKVKFYELAIGARFVFHGGRFEKIAMSMARDERGWGRLGEVFNFGFLVFSWEGRGNVERESVERESVERESVERESVAAFAPLRRAEECGMRHAEARRARTGGRPVGLLD
jgi:hypothetical protein